MNSGISKKTWLFYRWYIVHMATFRLRADHLGQLGYRSKLDRVQDTNFTNEPKQLTSIGHGNHKKHKNEMYLCCPPAPARMKSCDKSWVRAYWWCPSPDHEKNIEINMFSLATYHWLEKEICKKCGGKRWLTHATEAHPLPSCSPTWASVCEAYWAKH